MAARARLVILDNRDSFTFNIAQYAMMVGAHVDVVPCCDYLRHKQIFNQADGIIISPGPGAPQEAVESIQMLRQYAGHRPILGVCLGHQIIAEFYGARVVPAPRIMHGKVSRVRHTGAIPFCGLPEIFSVARYHSLIVDGDSVPPAVIVTAKVCDEGFENEIMGLAHCDLPIWGVQFHPEAIQTEHGHALLEVFVKFCKTERGLDAD